MPLLYIWAGWQLTCFNESTSLNEECYGGEVLRFAVGLSANQTGGLDACLRYQRVFE